MASLDLPWLDLEDEDIDADSFSFQEPEILSASLHDVDEAPSNWSSKVILPFPFPPYTGSPSLSSSNNFPAASGYPLRDWSPVPAKPINPATALPREYDNDVGGVLIMLLEPVMVEVKVEDTDDEVEEIEADMGFGALGVRTV